MTKRQLQYQLNELRACVIAVVRDIGPLTVKRAYYIDSDAYILSSGPSGDGESATLTITEKTGAVPESSTQH